MDQPQALPAAPPMAAQHSLKALPRAVWMAGGAALLTIAGLASALVMERSTNRQPQPSTAIAPSALTAPAQPGLAQPGQPAMAAAVQPGMVAPAQPGMATALAPNSDAGVVAAARPDPGASPYNQAPAVAAAGNREMARPAEVCARCGVIESVQAYQQKGQGTGLGAVAGGVVGGLLGNQVGKGNGRKAMTVVGAVGGGFAGHEIEKRARSVTRYQVKVRMDDGSLRTVTQNQPPAVGQRVSVKGRTLRVLHEPRNAAPDAPRTWNTSAPANGA